MSLLDFCNEALKGVCWWNNCCSMVKSCGGSPRLTGILERIRRHASIDTKSSKSLVYTPPRQRIIPPGHKLQRSRSLEMSHFRQGQMEDVGVL